MVKIEKEALLISPTDINSSQKNVGVAGIFNPGAARLKNGDIILYARVNEKLISWKDKDHYYSPRSVSKSRYTIKPDIFQKKLILRKNPPYGFYFHDNTVRLTYISHFRKIILSKDGFEIKQVDSKPSFYGFPGDGELGVEDARITYLKDEKRYIMTYVTLDRDTNISTRLATSKDCIEWKRHGIIFREQNKDVAIFSQKFKGEYAAFNRPSGDFEFSSPSIWLSYSKDLRHWGEDKIEALSRGSSWDSHKIGAGCPPIKTKHGWLEIYHGVKKVKDKSLFSFINPRHHLVYCAGAALFNLNTPDKLIARSASSNPLIYPTKDYEKKGFVNNVVFPSGAVLDDDNESLLIYSGGADTVITARKIKINEIISHLNKK